jgi:hypothetical protein
MAESYGARKCRCGRMVVAKCVYDSGVGVGSAAFYRGGRLQEMEVGGCS